MARAIFFHGRTASPPGDMGRWLGTLGGEIAIPLMDSKFIGLPISQQVKAVTNIWRAGCYDLAMGYSHGGYLCLQAMLNCLLKEEIGLIPPSLILVGAHVGLASGGNISVRMGGAGPLRRAFGLEPAGCDIDQIKLPESVNLRFIHGRQDSSTLKDIMQVINNFPSRMELHVYEGGHDPNQEAKDLIVGLLVERGILE